MSIAIIGAGMAGISCARALREAGREVVLFDKGRAAGGRMATKRVTLGETTIRIDHGAQYITARDAGFAALLQGQDVAPWPEPGRFVRLPAMSALPRALAQGLNIQLGRHVAALRRQNGQWMIDHLPADAVRPGRPLPDLAPEAAGPFDAVAVALPAPQAAPLLQPVAPALAAALEGVEYAPCWTWLAVFAERLDLPDILRPETGPIGWAARNNAKPGRDAQEAWVVQASPAWSRAHLEDKAGDMAAALRAALGAPAPLTEVTHRWRYSLVERALGRPCLWDGAAGLGLAGDYCLEGRVEAAFLSGQALAQAMTA
jgi:predicted NAD/FAD-dependent oxidoreductase